MKIGRRIRLLMVIWLASCHAYGQVDKIIEGAEEAAEIAELVSISTSIIETTTYTKEKLKNCKKNLEDLKFMVESPDVQRYIPENRRREWATKVRSKMRVVQMYSTVLSNVIKMLQDLQKKLGKQKALKGAVGRAIKQGVANAMVYVRKIPVYGEIIDGVAKAFGASSDDADMIPIENEALALGSVKEDATLEEQLIGFLLKINQFNESISKLEKDTEMLSNSFGATVGMSIMLNMPNRSIREYARHKNISVD